MDGAIEEGLYLANSTMFPGAENHLWPNIASTKEAFRLFAGGSTSLSIRVVNGFVYAIISKIQGKIWILSAQIENFEDQMDDWKVEKFWSNYIIQLM